MLSLRTSLKLRPYWVLVCCNCSLVHLAALMISMIFLDICWASQVESLGPLLYIGCGGSGKLILSEIWCLWLQNLLNCQLCRRLCGRGHVFWWRSCLMEHRQRFRRSPQCLAGSLSERGRNNSRRIRNNRTSRTRTIKIIRWQFGIRGKSAGCTPRSLGCIRNACLRKLGLGSLKLRFGLLEPSHGFGILFYRTLSLEFIGYELN